MAAWGLTLAEMRTRVYLLMQDPGATRWTAAVMTEQVNRGVATVAARTLCNIKETTSNIVAGTAGYAFPTDCPGIRGIREVHISGSFIEPVSKHHAQQMEVVGDEYTSGYTRWFARDEKIYLTPTPSSSTTSGLEVSHAYMPTELVHTTDDATAIDLPIELLDAAAYVIAAELALADGRMSLHDRLRGIADRDMKEFRVRGGAWQERLQTQVVVPDDAGYVEIQKRRNT